SPLPDARWLVEDRLPIDRLPAKQPFGLDQLSSTIRHLRVLAHPNAKINTVLPQPGEPRPANELAVGAQIQDRTPSEQLDELRHDGYAFGGVGVALFLEDGPQHRDGNAFVNNAKHEDVQGRLAKLPIAAIQCQHPGAGDANQGNQQNGNPCIANLEESQEALDAFVVRCFFGPARKNRGNLREVDGSHLNQSDEKLRQEVDAGFVPSYIVSKGSLKQANRGHRRFPPQVFTVL